MVGFVVTVLAGQRGPLSRSYAVSTVAMSATVKRSGKRKRSDADSSARNPKSAKSNSQDEAAAESKSNSGGKESKNVESKLPKLCVALQKSFKENGDASVATGMK